VSNSVAVSPLVFSVKIASSDMVGTLKKATKDEVQPGFDGTYREP
jgi:hypothetical protein